MVEGGGEDNELFVLLLGNNTFFKKNYLNLTN